MTDVALREYLEDKIKALDERIDQRFLALDKANELQAADRRDKTAMGLALFAIVFEVLIAIAMIWSKHA